VRFGFLSRSLSEFRIDETTLWPSTSSDGSWTSEECLYLGSHAKKKERKKKRKEKKKKLIDAALAAAGAA
jgi:hypothetical protein